MKIVPKKRIRSDPYPLTPDCIGERAADQAALINKKAAFP